MAKSPSAGPVPQFIDPHRRPTRLRSRTPGTARWLLALVNGDEANDFKFFLARGCCDFDFVADLAVKQRLADRRSLGDDTLFGVGFLAADKRVFYFCVALHVQHNDARAVAGAVLRA